MNNLFGCLIAWKIVSLFRIWNPCPLDMGTVVDGYLAMSVVSAIAEDTEWRLW
jgi:hypothetical protein